MSNELEQIANDLQAMGLTPQEFVRLHPQFSRQQMSELVQVSLDTVNGWFVGRQIPHRNHLLSLGVAHQMLSSGVPQAA